MKMSEECDEMQIQKRLMLLLRYRVVSHLVGLRVDTDGGDW